MVIMYISGLMHFIKDKHASYPDIQKNYNNQLHVLVQTEDIEWHSLLILHALQSKVCTTVLPNPIDWIW